MFQASIAMKRAGRARRKNPTGQVARKMANAPRAHVVMLESAGHGRCSVTMNEAIISSAPKGAETNLRNSKSPDGWTAH